MNIATQPVTTNPQVSTIARFVLPDPERPLVTATLPLAEFVRRALMRKCADVLRRRGIQPDRMALCRHCAAVTGKDEVGRPLTGHRHAHFLPADEDGDGRIDHVTVLAARGFSVDESRALEQLRELRFGHGEPLRVLLVRLGNVLDFDLPLLAESTTWVSATPFVATRYPKLRGQKKDPPEVRADPRLFAHHILGEELTRLRDRRRQLGSHLPALTQDGIMLLDEGIGRQRLSPTQFQRCRDKSDDDGGRRATGGFRLRFTRPVQGPLCLGHFAHFGLGLFVAEKE